jgi:hypothetical protein
MRTIAYKDETWEARSGGAAYFADGQENMKVLFRRQSDGFELTGRLPGVAIENFDRATDDQLVASLADAPLAPEDERVCERTHSNGQTVYICRTARDGAERFYADFGHHQPTAVGHKVTEDGARSGADRIMSENGHACSEAACSPWVPSN